jgi:hypothetical protein
VGRASASPDIALGRVRTIAAEFTDQTGNALAAGDETGTYEAIELE